MGRWEEQEQEPSEEKDDRRRKKTLGDKNVKDEVYYK